MDALDRLAAEHSAAGDALGALVGEVIAAARDAYDARRTEIDAAVTRCDTTKKALLAAVGDKPELFVAPRSKWHAGIKFGFAKARDNAYPSNDTPDLIRELHPELVSKLLKTTVVKAEALTQPAAVRKAIKVRVTRGRDAPFAERKRDDLESSFASLSALIAE